MKPLEDMTNNEKARVLHQLFPDEMPKMIEFIADMCKTIKESEDQNRRSWSDPFFTFDAWLRLLNEIDGNISRYGAKLNKNYKLFADQLFDGYSALFTIHCLITYTTTREHPNNDFTLAVKLFFK